MARQLFFPKRNSHQSIQIDWTEWTPLLSHYEIHFGETPFNNSLWERYNNISNLWMVGKAVDRTVFKQVFNCHRTTLFFSLSLIILLQLLSYIFFCICLHWLDHQMRLSSLQCFYERNCSSWVEVFHRNTVIYS